MRCAEYILRGRLPALAFLASAIVLIFENVNAVLYLKRSAAANSVFGPKRIKASLAGHFTSAILPINHHVYALCIKET